MKAVDERKIERSAERSTEQYGARTVVKAVDERKIVRSANLSAARFAQHIAQRKRLTRRFARRIAQRMAVDCSFFRSSTAFTTVFAPYCSADHSADRAIFRLSYCTANGTTGRLWVHSFLTLFDDYVNILRAVDSCTVLLGGWFGGSLITPARRRESSHLVR